MRCRRFAALSAALLAAVLFAGSTSRALGISGNNQTVNLWATLQASNAHLSSQAAYLLSVKAAIEQDQRQLQQLRDQLATTQSAFAMEQAELLPILRYQYEYGSADAWMWLALLTSSTTWEKLQSSLADLAYVRDRRLQVLQRAQLQLQRLHTLQLEAESDLEDLEVLQTALEFEQRTYRLVQAAAASDAGSQMSALANYLRQAWGVSIAPEVGSVLSRLDAMTYQLPDRLPPGAIRIHFPSAQVVVDQDILNSVLQDAGSGETIRFLFRTGETWVCAQDADHLVLVRGHFEIAAGGSRANYVADEVAIDGILLPTDEARRWLQPYSFYIDVTHLAPHVRLTDIVVQNRSLQLSLQMSVG